MDTHHTNMYKVKKFTLSSIIIVMTTVVCMVVKTFTDFINIAGALGSVTVAFILPQLFYVKTFGPQMSRGLKFGSFMIAFFGIIGSGYSIYFSVQKLSKGDLS
jgi:amino acid permease